MPPARSVLVPSPSAFELKLRPTTGGALKAERKAVRMAFVCCGIGAVALAVAWWLHANPVFSNPANFDEYGIPLVGGCLFFVLGIASFFGFSRSLVIDPVQKRVIFGNRRFWVSRDRVVPLSDCSLVTAPLHTELRHGTIRMDWDGHVLLVRSAERSFAFFASADPTLVSDRARKVSGETGLSIVDEAETISGLDS